MKYLLLTIFATNIIFYSFLLLKPNGDSFYFLIAQDNSLSDVFEILEEKEIFFPKIIKSIFVVTGTDQKIYQGNYQINKEDSVYEIFKKIYFGKIVLKKFIVSEGSQTRNLFSNELLATYCEQEKLMPCNLEGLVMPDTYFFTDRQQLERLMINQKIRLDNILTRLWENKPKDNPLKSMNEALVLASIVEREAAVEWERAQISSVFLSRIRDGWRLDADPTLIYGYYGDFSKKITKENLKAVKGDNNPFNTYKIKGLPPRPICYPSLSSIESVIMSSPGEYFFFVAKGDGTHIFSKTLDEHNKAVNNR